MRNDLAFIGLFEQHFGGTSETVTFKRNDLLTDVGQIEKFVYVVLEGAIRAYYISEHEEHSIRFGYQGSIINSLGSFMTQQPSELYVQALRKTVVKAIPRNAYLSFVESSMEVLKLHQELLSHIIGDQMERELDLLTFSPQERYQRVLKRSPQLFEEVPLKYIASYLRMTPETLSRLRSS